MNISLKINRARNTPKTAATGTDSPTDTLMSCEQCGLTGGPFAPAEAAHLRAVHDRLFHGFSSAA